MAEAGIITFLHNNNYGSALQAYALQRVVRELGYECIHLDYRPDRKVIPVRPLFCSAAADQQDAQVLYSDQLICLRRGL